MEVYVILGVAYRLLVNIKNLISPPPKGFNSFCSPYPYPVIRYTTLWITYTYTDIQGVQSPTMREYYKRPYFDHDKMKSISNFCVRDFTIQFFIKEMSKKTTSDSKLIKFQVNLFQKILEETEGPLVICLRLLWYEFCIYII